MAGVRVLVDLSTHKIGEDADVPGSEVASWHPEGPRAVFTGDRGRSIAAMAMAFERYISDAHRVGGLLGLGGSGGTALIAPAMRALAWAYRSCLVSDRRVRQCFRLCRAKRHRDDVFGDGSGRAEPDLADRPGQCGPRDCGMVAHRCQSSWRTGPAVGPYDVRRDHAVREPGCRARWDAESTAWFSTPPARAGSPWRSSPIPGCSPGVIDVTTTEVCDFLLDGRSVPLHRGPLRRHRPDALPYVGSCGALDMVNFGAREPCRRVSGRAISMSTIRR